MRPELVGVIAGVPHDRNTPSFARPAPTTGAHPAKTVTFDVAGTFDFVVPSWVRSIRRRAIGGGGGGGGATLFGGGGAGVGGWFCEDTVATTGGELWTVTVGAGGIGGTYEVAGVGGGNSVVVGSGSTLRAPGGQGGNRATNVAVGGPATGTNGSTPLGTIIRPGGGGGGGFIDGCGGGGGSSAGTDAAGVAGANGTLSDPGLGGVAPAGGGNGGDGALLNEAANPGVAPGGGAGATSYDPPVNGERPGAVGRVILSWEAVE